MRWTRNFLSTIRGVEGCGVQISFRGVCIPLWKRRENQPTLYVTGVQPAFQQDRSPHVRIARVAVLDASTVAVVASEVAIQIHQLAWAPKFPRDCLINWPTKGSTLYTRGYVDEMGGEHACLFPIRSFKWEQKGKVVFQPTMSQRPSGSEKVQLFWCC